MMRRSFLATGLLLLTVSASATAQNIVIGQSTPLSGPAADIGRDIRDGAQAWFERVNAAGGVNGRRITLVTLDDANDKTRAAENAQTLVAERGALALFGFASATLSVNAIPIAEKAGLAFFAPFTGSLSIRGKPVVFTVRASYKDEAERIVAHQKSVGATKTVVLHYDDDVGKVNYETVAAVVAAAGGGAKPRGVAVKRGAKIEAAAFDAVVADDPHYVLATTQSPPVVDLLRMMADKGRQIPIVALSFVNPDELASVAGSNARGTIVAQVVPTPRALANPNYTVVKDCADALTALNGAALNYTTLESCIAAKILVEGLRRAGPSFTRASLIKGLESIGRVDVGGFFVTLGPGNHHGSKWVDLSILSRGNLYRN
jgi:ABC-type branched-subunit amino acid transport system substrate-binding protein